MLAWNNNRHFAEHGLEARSCRACIQVSHDVRIRTVEKAAGEQCQDRTVS